ncbi:MAG TPA: hypothetical protein VGB05_03545, partial [Pyrinomonadaceae bacterium]
MTGLRIKILKRREPPAGLRIRIKRWFSHLSAWFKVQAGRPPGTTRERGQQIRVINSTRPTTTGATPTHSVSTPAGPTRIMGDSRAANARRVGSSSCNTGPAARSIVVNEGERKCKTCGEPLLNGGTLVECSGNPSHKIHRQCVE